MSFVGGGSECAVNNNVVSQLNKHTQQDRSLQQQASQPLGGVIQNQGFKRDNLINARDRQNLDQFMNNAAPQGSSFQYQQMRHELNTMHPSPQCHKLLRQ